MQSSLDPHLATAVATAATIAPGRYRHYKGNDYEVLGVATHSETHEALVVYRPLYGEGAWWVRPLAMFAETVLVNGQAQPRFAPQ